MSAIINNIVVTLKWALRDRLLHAVIGVALLLLLVVPVFSVFSLRQVQELSITLSLSAISIILFILATLLGASSVWRDIERRYTTSVLSLPVSRASFVMGKFCGIALFLMLCAVVLGVTAAVVINVATYFHPSELPVHWRTLGVALVFDCLKYILLAAAALCFSCLSTSFFLPVFATIALYLAGNASQEVFEYVTGEFGKSISPPAQLIIKVIYYIIPNFSAFNLKVQAIYGLPLTIGGLTYTMLYFIIYTGILLNIAVWLFSRRELP